MALKIVCDRCYRDAEVLYDQELYSNVHEIHIRCHDETAVLEWSIRSDEQQVFVWSNLAHKFQPPERLFDRIKGHEATLLGEAARVQRYREVLRSNKLDAVRSASYNPREIDDLLRSVCDRATHVVADGRDTDPQARHELWEAAATTIAEAAIRLKPKP